MNEQHKAPLQENTKDDSSDVERVKRDKERLGNELHSSESAPPETGKTKEEEEAEKGHS